MRAAAAALALLLASCSSADVLLFDAAADKSYPPEASIEVSGKDIKPWVARDKTARGWCFFRAANVATVDGEFWAVNGIARDIVEHGGSISVGGKRSTLRDIDTTRGAQREFLFTINDRINDACP